MDEIEVIKRRLLIKYPFFGSIIANSEFIDSDSVDTAGTDGKKIYYNPEFMKNLKKDEVTFIFAHEVCHIAFDHVLRSEGKDPYLWNIATDSVINALLSSDGLPIIEGGIDMPEAINYNAEEMYDKLVKEQELSKDNSKNNEENSNNDNSSNKMGNSNNQQSNKKSNISNKGSSNKTSSESDTNTENDSHQNGNESKEDNETNESKDVGHDTHNMWQEAVEKSKQEDTVEDNKQEDKEKEQKKEKTIKRASKLGEKETFKQNKITRKKQLEELQESLAKESSGAGNSSNGDVRNVGSVGVAKALIDWRKLLKEAVKLDVDWSYKNAFIEEGIVNANLEEMPYSETEIVLDTSGSVNETLLKNFLRECKNILQTSKVKVGCFDTVFYGFEEIKNVYDIDKMKFKGGGGTDFNAAVNAFSNRVENKIIFTDGEASMPHKVVDAIWVVFGNTRINPKGGKVIYINKEQLSKLHSLNKSR